MLITKDFEKRPQNKGDNLSYRVYLMLYFLKQSVLLF